MKLVVAAPVFAQSCLHIHSETPSSACSIFCSAIHSENWWCNIICWLCLFGCIWADFVDLTGVWFYGWDEFWNVYILISIFDSVWLSWVTLCIWQAVKIQLLTTVVTFVLFHCERFLVILVFHSFVCVLCVTIFKYKMCVRFLGKFLMCVYVPVWFYVQFLCSLFFLSVSSSVRCVLHCLSDCVLQCKVCFALFIRLCPPV